MVLKPSLLGLMVILLLGCAARPPVREVPVTVKVPPQPAPLPPAPSVPQLPTKEKDLFQAFPEKYRLKAVDFEKNKELGRALFCWKVVHSFIPKDREASQKIKALENRMGREAEKHFRRGLDFFQKNFRQAAGREFLMALTYQPDHGQALNYLKQILTEPDYWTYETEEGDTLPKISRQIYRDSELSFLISYFNDLDSGDKLRPGMKLKIPPFPLELMARPVYPKETPKKPDPLPKPGKILPHSPDQAEVHYQKGVKYFIAEDLPQAIKEWEETLRLNPEHPKAWKDLEKAQRLLENLGRVK